jgi:hypothetical protein
MYYFNFVVAGLSGAQVTYAGKPQEIYPQVLVSTLLTGLSAAGFTRGDVMLENEDPQFRALKNGTTYLIGGQGNRI